MIEGNVTACQGSISICPGVGLGENKPIPDKTHLLKKRVPVLQPVLNTENKIGKPFTISRRFEKNAIIAAFFVDSIDIKRKLR
jgi:hypothetical protein